MTLRFAARTAASIVTAGLMACGVGTSGSATNSGRDASAYPGFGQDSAGGGNQPPDSSASVQEEAATVSPLASLEAGVDGLADYAMDATPDSPGNSSPDSAVGSVGDAGDGDAAGLVDAPEGDAEAGSCVSGAMRCDGLQPQSCGPGGWQSAGPPCPLACTGAGVCEAPMCRTLADGSTASQCAAGQDCCNDSMSNEQTCAASCASPSAPLDCLGNTGNDQCAAGTLCCGTLVLVGGTVGSCTAATLSSSCKSRCAENLPGLSCGSTQNPLTFTLRLCTAKADCAGDATRTNCCAYNDSPIHWCVASQILTTDCKQ